MIRQTGGSAFGAISTKSTPSCSARRKASAVLTIPSCSPSTPIRRTSGMRISALIRLVFSVAMLRSPKINQFTQLHRHVLTRLHVATQALHKFIQRHGAQIQVATPAYRYGGGFTLFFANDQDIRHFL